jgi:hypothetical protein
VTTPLEAARKLAPLIRASAPETDAQRELPRPLFEAMADAGLFSSRCLGRSVARRWTCRAISR